MVEQTEKILQGILQHCNPLKVVLYGEKYRIATKQLKSIDVCIIITSGNKNDLLRRLYLEIEAEIPFQVQIYTLEEWEKSTQDKASYASVIAGRGRVIYEQKP